MSTGSYDCLSCEHHLSRELYLSREYWCARARDRAVWTMPEGCSKENVTLGLSRLISIMCFCIANAQVSAMYTVRFAPRVDRGRSLDREKLTALSGAPADWNWGGALTDEEILDMVNDTVHMEHGRSSAPFCFIFPRIHTPQVRQ